MPKTVWGDAPFRCYYAGSHLAGKPFRPFLKRGFRLPGFVWMQFSHPNILFSRLFGKQFALPAVAISSVRTTRRFPGLPFVRVIEFEWRDGDETIVSGFALPAGETDKLMFMFVDKSGKTP